MPRTCILILLAGALSTGCAVLARQQKDKSIDPLALTEIEEGMPKEEVTRILGAPTEIIFSNKEHDPLREHAYIYEHFSTRYTGIWLAFLTFGNADQKRDRVVIWLDEEGKVKHVGASLHADESSYGFPFGR